MAIEFNSFDPDGDLFLLLGPHPKIDDDTECSSPADVGTPETSSTTDSGTNDDDGFRNSTTLAEGSSEESAARARAVHMLVSSKSLMLASPVFRAMLRHDTFPGGQDVT
jgi:hypothetical protein